jgi:hypothetical protein
MIPKVRFKPKDLAQDALKIAEYAANLAGKVEYIELEAVQMGTKVKLIATTDTAGNRKEFYLSKIS